MSQVVGVRETGSFGRFYPDFSMRNFTDSYESKNYMGKSGGNF